MWRVVCVGPGPMDRVRRVHDRGPLHHDKGRAHSFAEFLRSTGLYESVKVEESTLKAAAVATSPNPPPNARDASDGGASPKAEKSLDDLSSLLDESPAADPASPEESGAG
jgi:hypothetical protein